MNEVGIKIPGDLREMLHATLADYKRWLLDGKPKYGYQSRGGEQMYYDTYHCQLRGEPDGEMMFTIQIHDSPEGDIWWRGRFRVRPDGTLKVLESKAE